ncbi:putative lipoprotein [Treponema primitia ZAS-2]|uniref:Putative lipoprotein n=1 Tax=Treponema primitia (strain ATCC BAA-887 / DSM 12427 / ZAS-2) TaxID=545694 RepID=F5YJR1_TREPZ|nr:hypothetical protein [Treponema primitia]AEF84313.1 putative lipoprotein [Treponema primitia ZAS-2]
MYKKLSLVSLAILVLISCENPIQAGLGNKVDIEPPKVNLVSPSPSKNPFIWGSNVSFEINATDDMSISRVSITVTGKKPDGSGNVSITKDATSYISSNGGNYLVTLDTLNELGFEGLNGDVTVKLQAWDGTGKAVVSEELPFRVKNGPPTVEVQTPLKEEDKELAEMISGGYLGGVANDDMGIAQGYPKIKFWLDGNDEPDDWSDMDSDYPDDGKKFVNFRYYGIAPDAHPYKPSSTVKPQGLPTGTYSYRLLVWDGILEDGKQIHVAQYPPKEDAPWKLEIIKANELPKITFTPLVNDYQNKEFTIEANLSHSAGIGIATLSVRKAGDAAATILARAEFTANTLASDPPERMERILKSHVITPGTPYEQTDFDPKYTDEDLEDYTFTDGEYEFTVATTSNQGSESSKAYTVYIDTTPPEVDVSRIQPNVEESEATDKMKQFIVNGFIAADVVANDANNIGYDKEQSDYREIKYLISTSKEDDPVTLYNNAAATFFDAPEAPVYKKAGTSASVVIDTTAFTSRLNYLHIVAKDKAGNYKRSVVLLDADQDTDKPKIVLTSLVDTIGTEAALLATTDNRLLNTRVIQGSFLDDDGVRLEDIIWKNDNTGSVKFYNKDGAPITGTVDVVISPLAPTPVPPALPRKEVSFTATLSTDVPDGIYSFEIGIADDKITKNYLQTGTAITTVLNASPAASQHVYFILDTKSPVLTETIINTDAVTRQSMGFSLGGTVSDLVGMKSLVISEQGNVRSKAKFGSQFRGDGIHLDLPGHGG